MTVLEILKRLIVEVGADGLCNNGCGCGVGDLAPCEYMRDCVIAWKHVDANCENDCNPENDCYMDKSVKHCYRPFPQKK